MLIAFGRMVLSLSVVLGLLWLVARVGRARQAGGRLRRSAPVPTGQIDLIGRRSVGRNCSIAVVRVDGRTLVVGQTPQQITLLADTRLADTRLADTRLADTRLADTRLADTRLAGDPGAAAGRAGGGGGRVAGGDPPATPRGREGSRVPTVHTTFTTDAVLPTSVGTTPVPGLAPGQGADAPTAWDALLERLREMTVRR